MSSQDDAGGASPYVSIAARLGERCGEPVDPAVSLADATLTPATRATPSRERSTSGTLERLSARQPQSTRYRIEGELARGGMGAILEAYDIDLRRRLAMKVVLGDESGAQSKLEPAKLARFLEEAQITGQLDHPGIVPVHELGLDERGHAYFTMRLVRGRDLDAIFRLVPTGTDGWTMTRAVGALLKVCEAMAFAHGKGVVHRDLKPANVMVGEFGEVYVMDWGLARVLRSPDRHDVRLKEEPQAPRLELDRRDSSGGQRADNLYTMDGDVMGTPSYMAPEQARGKLAEIGEKSDIYSVGAMLYRLLAGIEPYGSRENSARALAVLQALRSAPPTPVAELASNPPRELLAICERAMARDADDRYDDMLSLAADLRAYLEGRVVAAYEAGTWAEARKWVTRNRALAASIAAAVFALVVGLGASVALGRRAAHNAELADEQRVAALASADEARRQAQIARASSDFLNIDLLTALAPENEGREVTVLQVLDRASSDLSARFAGEPAVEAALQLTIGKSYALLGQNDSARRHLERALELSAANDPRGADSILGAQLALASVLTALDRTDEAFEAYDDVLETARELKGPEHHATLTAMNDRALLLKRLGRRDEARAAFQEVLAIDRRVLGEDHDDTLAVENNLALVDGDAGRLDDSVARLRRVLELRTANHGPRHPSVVESTCNLALALTNSGKFDEAERLGREGLAASLEVFGPDHPRTASAHGILGLTIWQRGRAAESLTYMARALELTSTLHGEDHPLALLARGNYASVLLDLNRLDEAAAEAERTLEGQRRALGLHHPDTLGSLNRVASIERSLGRYENAEKLFRELIASEDEVLGSDHPESLIARENLGGVLYTVGRYDESEKLVREVLAARRRVLGEDHPFVAKSTYNVAMIVKGRGDKTAALELFLESHAHQREHGEAETPLALECLRQIGDLQLGSKDYAAAVETYRAALELASKLETDGGTLAFLEHQLGSALVETGDLEGGLASLRSALAARESLLGPDDRATRVSLYRVADALMRSERFEGSAQAALDFYGRTLRADGPTHEYVQRARKLLAEVYSAWGREDEAAKWRQDP